MVLRVSLGRSRVVGPTSVSRVRGGRVVMVDGPDSVVVGVVSSGLMSVVTGGLVLVIVSVVAGDPEFGVLLSVTEYVGSTKSIGAGSGSLAWPVTYLMAPISSASRASAAALTPSSVDGRLCHAGFGASSLSGPVTGTDSNRASVRSAGSAELRDDRLGDELDVLEVRHVENLQIDALDATLQEGAEPVDDLVGGADGWGVGA